MFKFHCFLPDDAVYIAHDGIEKVINTYLRKYRIPSAVTTAYLCDASIEEIDARYPDVLFIPGIMELLGTYQHGDMLVGKVVDPNISVVSTFDSDDILSVYFSTIDAVLPVGERDICSYHS